MRRRDFVTFLGGATAAWPLAARAQQPVRMRRIGVLMGVANDAVARGYYAPFLQELEKLGWTAGRNITIDERWGGGNMDLIRAHAAELSSLRPDAIVAYGIRALTAMHQQTTIIPIVAMGLPNNYVENFGRPAGNVTGFTTGPGESSTVSKLVETLKKIAPHVTSVAFVRQSDNDSSPTQLPSFNAAAQSLGMRPVDLLVRDQADLEQAIPAFAREPNGGLVLAADVFLATHRDLIIGLAAQHRLPAIYTDRFYAASGGLMSYGSDRRILFRQAADYVNRLLKGEKVADLPVQAPTKWEFVLNLKTAKALGLDIPPMMLALTDEVIE
jgi:putative tryptophan/tyrosine transport system substrate-binding protein